MAKRGMSTDPTRADEDKYRSQIGEEVRVPLTDSQLAKLDEIIEDVPDVNDPVQINYWVKLNDYDVYIEGWADQCLAGTGFPIMERGGTAEKLNYMEDLTPGILERKAQERGLELVGGGFRELPDAEALYGVTWGVYRKRSSNPGHNPGNPGPLTPEEERRASQILGRSYLLKPEHVDILVLAHQYEGELGRGTSFVPGGRRGALNQIEELLDAYPDANPERQEHILRQIARATDVLRSTPELTYHIPVHREAPPSLAEVRHMPPPMERARITEGLENPGNPGAKEPYIYKYSWTLPRGEKRFTDYAHGASWADALKNIREFHPKRSNIRRLEIPSEAGVIGVAPNPGNPGGGKMTNDVPELVKRGVFEYKTYGKFKDWYLASKAEKDAVDKWLVRTKHPIAFEPGTQERRYEHIIKELAQAESSNPGGVEMTDYPELAAKPAVAPILSRFEEAGVRWGAMTPSMRQRMILSEIPNFPSSLARKDWWQLTINEKDAIANALDRFLATHHSWSTPRVLAAVATGALTGLVGSPVPVVGLAGGLLAQVLEKQNPQLLKVQYITAGVVDGSAALIAKSLFTSIQARPMKLTLTEEELDKLEFEAAKKGEYVPSPPRPTKEQFKEILREKLLKKD